MYIMYRTVYRTVPLGTPLCTYSTSLNVYPILTFRVLLYKYELKIEYAIPVMPNELFSKMVYGILLKAVTIKTLYTCTHTNIYI